MSKTRRPLFLSMVVLLIVLGLLTGCYRPAAPDVTQTPAGGEEGAPPPEEGTPDLMATGNANATLAAEPTEESEAAPTETMLSPAPTLTSTLAPETAAPTTVPATAAPTEPAPTPAPTGQSTHVVQPGENLFRIALRYGTTTQAVASANGIANPALIYVGQTLIIPSGGQPSPPTEGATTYVVQPGDNLFRIALRYNMSHLYLAQHNGIANPASIYAGQVIHIPPH